MAARSLTQRWKSKEFILYWRLEDLILFFTLLKRSKLQFWSAFSQRSKEKMVSSDLAMEAILMLLTLYLSVINSLRMLSITLIWTLITKDWPMELLMILSHFSIKTLKFMTLKDQRIWWMEISLLIGMLSSAKSTQIWPILRTDFRKEKVIKWSIKRLQIQVFLKKSISL